MRKRPKLGDRIVRERERGSQRTKLRLFYPSKGLLKKQLRPRRTEKKKKSPLEKIIKEKSSLFACKTEKYILSSSIYNYIYFLTFLNLEDRNLTFICAYGSL